MFKSPSVQYVLRFQVIKLKNENILLEFRILLVTAKLPGLYLITVKRTLLDTSKPSCQGGSIFPNLHEHLNT